jgi:hypothetical protein
MLYNIRLHLIYIESVLCNTICNRDAMNMALDEKSIFFERINSTEDTCNIGILLLVYTWSVLGNSVAMRILSPSHAGIKLIFSAWTSLHSQEP